MITKELFISAIDAIKQQFEHDDKCGEALKVLFSDGGGFYDYYPVLYALETVLKNDLDDNGEGSLIEYFIYELDFGKKWTKHSITEKDGKPVKMRNAGELYDYLILAK